MATEKAKETQAITTPRPFAGLTHMEQEMERTMRTRLLMVVAVLGALWLAPGVSVAADQSGDRGGDRDRVQSQKHEQVYGSQLMTKEERDAYQVKMRAAKTDAEREQIRKAHHVQMQARAKERGVTLPEEPPMRGRGMGPGEGMGPGGGVGPGGGR